MRVLVIVEDDLRMAALLRRDLEEEGYTVDVPSNRPAADQHATEFGHNAVQLDVTLPAGAGAEVCSQPPTVGQRTPMLVVAAPNAVAARHLGMGIDAADYLTKPLSIAEVSARVRALIRRGADQRLLIPLQVADLRLDPASRQAWRGDSELDLSLKEFALLELFIRHPGEVLTRTRILDHAWDVAYCGTSNVVDQYVLCLRRKIDRPFGVEQIETVRGAGYRLRAEATVLRSQ